MIFDEHPQVVMCLIGFHPRDILHEALTDLLGVTLGKAWAFSRTAEKPRQLCPIWERSVGHPPQNLCCGPGSWVCVVAQGQTGIEVFVHDLGSWGWRQLTGETSLEVMSFDEISPELKAHVFVLTL